MQITIGKKIVTYENPFEVQTRAHQGDPQAQCALYILFAREIEIEKDSIKKDHIKNAAKDWCKKSALQGFDPAKFFFGKTLFKEIEEKLEKDKLWQKAKGEGKKPQEQAWWTNIGDELQLEKTNKQLSIEEISKEMKKSVPRYTVVVKNIIEMFLALVEKKEPEVDVVDVWFRLAIIYKKLKYDADALFYYEKAAFEGGLLNAKAALGWLYYTEHGDKKLAARTLLKEVFKEALEIKNEAVKKFACEKLQIANKKILNFDYIDTTGAENLKKIKADWKEAQELMNFLKAASISTGVKIKGNWDYKSNFFPTNPGLRNNGKLEKTKILKSNDNNNYLSISNP